LEKVFNVPIKKEKILKTIVIVGTAEIKNGDQVAAVIHNQ